MSGKGRPTKYKKEFCIQAEKLCKKGFIDTEIADFFEVALSTLNKWKLDHKEFSESLKSGKRHSDDKVVDALYNRALGYEITEVKNEESEQGKKVVSHKKHVAGDVGAMCFWLKNRQPEKWRDKQEIEQKVTMQNIMPVPTADSIDSWEESAQTQQNTILSKADE